MKQSRARRVTPEMPPGSPSTSPAKGDLVRLTVCDDGDANTSGRGPIPGYGVFGMTERAVLLGGVLRVGSDPEGGWTVEAVLPKGGASTN